MEIGSIMNGCLSDGLDIMAKFCLTIIVFMFPEIVVFGSYTPFTLLKEKISYTWEILTEVLHLELYGMRYSSTEQCQ